MRVSATAKPSKFFPIRIESLDINGRPTFGPSLSINDDNGYVTNKRLDNDDNGRMTNNRSEDDDDEDDKKVYRSSSYAHEGRKLYKSSSNIHDAGKLYKSPSNLHERRKLHKSSSNINEHSKNSSLAYDQFHKTPSSSNVFSRLMHSEPHAHTHA